LSALEENRAESFIYSDNTNPSRGETSPVASRCQPSRTASPPLARHDVTNVREAG
jgi:hypothetical protein